LDDNPTVARTIAVANQKGGVGKTTIAMHVARFLALAGQRTVLADMDPQANATMGLASMRCTDAAMALDGVEAKAADFALLPSPGAARVITKTPKLDPAALDRVFTELGEWAAWIVVDCPPRIDDWGWAALCLADKILIPVQPEFFSLQGLAQAFRVIEQVTKARGTPLELLGVVVNMEDRQAPVANEVMADLRGHLGSQVFRTVVARDPVFAEAASHGVTVWEHAPTSLATRMMASLTREVLSGGA
jgi:chromosome partitioning protein